MKKQKKIKSFKKNDPEVKNALAKFEALTCYETGVNYHSGGFAVAELWDEDKDYFILLLKWGIQNDTENTVHTENWKMSKTTLKITED